MKVSFFFCCSVLILSVNVMLVVFVRKRSTSVERIMQRNKRKDLKVGFIFLVPIALDKHVFSQVWFREIVLKCVAADSDATT